MKKFYIFIAISIFTLSSCATRVATTTVVPETNVVVVKKVPRNHKVVIIKGKRYYRWNGRYHRKTSRGYVVVNL